MTTDRGFVSRSSVLAVGVLLLCMLMGVSLKGPSQGLAATDGPGMRPIAAHAEETFTAGRKTFRFDTFGDESFWGDSLGLHRAIEGAGFGGVGPGVSPQVALAAGLKVDVDALPKSVTEALKQGLVDLNDPAVTVELLRLGAVVGVIGFFDGATPASRAPAGIRTLGVTCALCHSTVDDSFAPGIGRRLDGWANRDLNIGAVISLAPNLKPVTDLLGVDESTLRLVLNSWGPGKFDAGVFVDGQAFRPDGKTAATLIPPACGLAGVNLHTWTGWGSVTYWNAFVANLLMHGKGTFYDPRLDDAAKFPVAARAGFGHIQNDPDLITPKLAALHFYQLAIPAPVPPDGSYDKDAALRGKTFFDGKARCATCHVPPLFTEPGWNMHSADEIGIDSFQSSRAPDGRYRTSPLKGLWAHGKGGYYHDGRFATLHAVVDHYNSVFKLGLTEQEILDLIEYLKSL